MRTPPRPAPAQAQLAVSPKAGRGYRTAAEHLRDECGWLWRQTAARVAVQAGEAVGDLDLDGERHAIDRRVAETLASGVDLPMVRLSQRLQLSSIEVRTLILLA
ncbi:MAG TPA: hypothetical protein VET65_02860, partial [Candidatus Limnocylindrales bacterium]|nr:hypothetical protein [Candidatus Limnocylindrales bacterium]